MSEPTDGGRQPDPDRDYPDQRTSEGQQDQTSEPMFSDPTAPVWIDPTTAVPAPPPLPAQPTPPTPPGAAQPQGNPPPEPPMSNPYAQQPPAQPYSQPAQPYDQQQPGQPYPAYGQSPYVTGPQTEANTSAIVLTILSGLSLFVCNFLAIGSLAFGIGALSKQAKDMEGSRRLSKVGWIIFAGSWVIGLLVVVVGIAFLIADSSSGPSSDLNF